MTFQVTRDPRLGYILEEAVACANLARDVYNWEVSEECARDSDEPPDLTVDPGHRPCFRVMKSESDPADLPDSPMSLSVPEPFSPVAEVVPPEVDIAHLTDDEAPSPTPGSPQFNEEDLAEFHDWVESKDFDVVMTASEDSEEEAGPSRLDSAGEPERPERPYSVEEFVPEAAHRPISLKDEVSEVRWLFESDGRRVQPTRRAKQGINYAELAEGIGS